MNALTVDDSLAGPPGWGDTAGQLLQAIACKQCPTLLDDRVRVYHLVILVILGLDRLHIGAVSGWNKTLEAFRGVNHGVRLAGTL